MDTQTSSTPTLDRTALGRAVEHWRMRANITPVQLARAMEGTHPAWRRVDLVLAVETGRREVKATEVPELAQALGISVARLLAGPDDDGARVVLRARIRDARAAVERHSEARSAVGAAHGALGRAWYSLHPLDPDDREDPTGPADPDYPDVQDALRELLVALGRLPAGAPDSQAPSASDPDGAHSQP